MGGVLLAGGEGLLWPLVVRGTLCAQKKKWGLLARSENQPRVRRPHRGPKERIFFDQRMTDRVSRRSSKKGIEGETVREKKEHQLDSPGERVPLE